MNTPTEWGHGAGARDRVAFASALKNGSCSVNLFLLYRV